MLHVPNRHSNRVPRGHTTAFLKRPGLLENYSICGRHVFIHSGVHARQTKPPISLLSLIERDADPTTI